MNGDKRSNAPRDEKSDTNIRQPRPEKKQAIPQQSDTTPRPLNSSLESGRAVHANGPKPGREENQPLIPTPEEALQAIIDGENLPEEVLKNSLTLTRHSIHSGPIPAPEQFAQYEQILPGSADRILCMAEESLRQQGQARDNETIEKKAESFSLKVLSVTLALIAPTAICMVGFGTILDKPVATFGGVLVGILAVIPNAMNSIRRNGKTEDSPN